jgi:ATP-dependent RNA helicase SUPV3L1/SUV3
MGLNMDIDHVAFAKLSKFDGVRPRRLTAQEVGQIAGRAGRHMTNGTFGTTGTMGELDPDLVEAVENHRFDPLTLLMWRNSDLDFRSPTTLLRSLDAPPPYNCLRRMRDADDHKALVTLAHDPDVVARAQGRKTVELLWEVCQVPDFRKVMSDQHTRLLSQIFLHLATAGRVPDDWVDGQVRRLESTDGDIDTLVTRIAHIRTWTYVANRPSWIARPIEWQERTRAIEDRLSDALHERLTQRFIDRRAAGLVRSLEKGGDLLAGVQPGGAVVVEGHPVGQLAGFRFQADATALGSDAKPVLTAARRALRSEIARRVALLAQAPDDEFTLTAIDQIAWNGAPVARLAQGGVLLKPRIVPLESDLLASGESDRIRDRAAAWLEAEIARRLPMVAAIAEAELEGPARGLAFQLAESLAPIERAQVEPLLASLKRKEASHLARLGVTIGASYVFLKGLTKPAALILLRALWRSGHDVWGELPMPPPGRVSIAADPSIDHAYYAAIGFPVVGPRAIRIDMLDRLIARLRRATVEGTMPPDPTIAPVLGCGKEEADQVLAALGWRRRVTEGAVTYRRQRPAQSHNVSRRRRVPPLTHDERSPFAVLKQLGVAK